MFKNIGSGIFTGIKFCASFEALNHLGFFGPYPVFLRDTEDKKYDNVEVEKKWLVTTVTYDVLERDEDGTTFNLVKSVEQRHHGATSIIHIKDGTVLTQGYPLYHWKNTYNTSNKILLQQKVDEIPNDLTEQERRIKISEINKKYNNNGHTVSFKFGIFPYNVITFGKIIN